MKQVLTVEHILFWIDEADIVSKTCIVKIDEVEIVSECIIMLLWGKMRQIMHVICE